MGKSKKTKDPESTVGEGLGEPQDLEQKEIQSAEAEETQEPEGTKIGGSEPESEIRKDATTVNPTVASDLPDRNRVPPLDAQDQPPPGGDAVAKPKERGGGSKTQEQPEGDTEDDNGVSAPAGGWTTPKDSAARVNEVKERQRALDSGNQESEKPLPAIEFTSVSNRAEFANLHPRVQDRLHELQVFCRDSGLPGPKITEVTRSVPEQESTYGDYWIGIFSKLSKRADLDDGERAAIEWLRHKLPKRWARVLSALVDGKEVSKDDSDEMLPGPDGKLTELQRELRKLARFKFTWHWVRCAVDIRTTGGGEGRMSNSQARAMFDHLKGLSENEKDEDGNPLWEIVLHSVKGPHIHLGFKDPKYRVTFMPAPEVKGA